MYIYSYCTGVSEPHVHLWSAASQQIDQSRVEGHDGVAHVDDFPLLFATPATNTHRSVLEATQQRKERQQAAVSVTGCKFTVNFVG